jgi:hypothetical protein
LFAGLRSADGGSGTAALPAAFRQGTAKDINVLAANLYKGNVGVARSVEILALEFCGVPWPEIMLEVCEVIHTEGVWPMDDKPVKPVLALVRAHPSAKEGGAKAAKRRAIRGNPALRLFVEGGDLRSPWSIRWKNLILAHMNDLGGAEVLSEAQISICKRASAMECELEFLEARMSEGQDVDLDQYGRLAGRLCRMFEIIGIERLARPLDPTGELAKAFEGYAGKPVDDDEDEPLPIEQGFDKSEPGEA